MRNQWCKGGKLLSHASRPRRVTQRIAISHQYHVFKLQGCRFFWKWKTYSASPWSLRRRRWIWGISRSRWALCIDDHLQVGGDVMTIFSLALLDWNDSETDLAHLGGAAPGSAKSGGDKLWEDNWDDDDIEDEFSVQLRCVLGFDLQMYPVLNLLCRNELEKTKAANTEAMEH